MIIADTGFWLALANRKDKHHERAKNCLARLEEPLITTWPVMAETCYLLLSRLRSVAQERFIQSYTAGAFEVFELNRDHAPKILQSMKRYRNLPMDLADASLLILAEHLGHGRILSTDERDFKTYRWKRHKPFTNLMFED
jgi:predicted nucleic acid-binding protein